MTNVTVVDAGAERRAALLAGLSALPLHTVVGRSAFVARSAELASGVFVAEGETVAGRALAAGYRATVVLVDAARDDPLPPGLGADVPVVRAGPSVVTAITGYQTHRGALVALARRPLPSAEAVLSDAGRVVVTEAVVNPTNLGVIVRSAAALGLDAVLLDPTSCDPLYRRANRASMGLGFALPHARLDPLPDGLAPVRDAGFTVVALTPSADAVDLRSWADGLDPDDRVALVLGSEGPGLTAATEDPTRCARLPTSASCWASSHTRCSRVGVARRAKVSAAACNWAAVGSPGPHPPSQPSVTERASDAMG